MKNLHLIWLFFIPFLINFFCIDLILVSGQCQTDQQSLLLQIKNNLIYNSSLSANLARWNQSTDCCDWGGVDCDAAGGVIGLNLSNESITGGIEKSSALFNLENLQSLNLAFNGFKSIEIPSGLGNLTNLRYLNLSNAGFTGQIPVAISGLTRLVTLDLSTFLFSGTALLKLENPNLRAFVQNLKELRELYLDGVNISAHGNEWCQALSSSLPNLQVLSLSNCFLSGPIDSSLAKLGLLSVIRLDQNNLSSPVPEFLADFSNLTDLHLSNCGLNGRFPGKIFQVPTLETLDLTKNELLQGSLPDLPENLALRTLLLSGTQLSESLPGSFGNLRKLSTIDLANCNFTGVIPTSIGNLTQLVYLDFSSNSFAGPVPSFHMSRNLTYLDLSRNVLTGAISSTEWEHLRNLVYVDLRFNSLNGSIPPSLFALPSLEELHLGNNRFVGRVPEILNASTSILDTLDLSGNRLGGPIPNSIFELRKLNILLLSFNKFNGTLRLDKVQKLGKLTTLDLSYNSLIVNASGGDSPFLPQISTLRLASCKLSVIPDLKNQTKLFFLDLSENQISGEIPNWIWRNGNLNHVNLSSNLLVGLQQPNNISIRSLTVLDLHSNQLQGKIPHPPSTAIYVDYSSNNFSASIPADIGNILPYAMFLSLSNNSLTGVIPDSICNATSLQVLDLSDNNLSGKVPTCLIEMGESFGVLNLRKNSLIGTISDTFSENCGLQTLDINGNDLEGTVPKSLANCKRLEVLDLGNNHIIDTFPCWLKNISSLRVLVLRSNRFYGNIGCPHINGSWTKLQIVDLALNRFNGTLPGKCLNTWEAMTTDEDEVQSKLKHLRFEFLGLSQLYYQDAVTVTSKGLEMELVKILNLFTSIDLSCNNIEGPIPEEIGRFKSLYVLNLSHNALTGEIPSSIGNLRQLESLDLSKNNLNGSIPTDLASLTFLSFLNLSYNHLVGTIPLSTQLQSFSPSSFEGNEGLCGPPLTDECNSSSKLQPSAPIQSFEFDWQFIVTGVGFGLGSGAAVAPLFFSKKVNKLYDDRIDKFLMVIMPMLGLMYTNSHDRRIEAEENLEDENTDDEDEEEEDEYENHEFRGRYCVFCSKLDITRKKVIHDPRCTWHHSSPISSYSYTSSSFSS